MPEWKAEIRRRLAGLQLAPTRESAIVEELSQYLDDCYDELLAGGATEAEAYRQTLAELSGSELLRRELRRVERQVAPEPITLGTNRRTNMISDLWQDLRFGARMLAKQPGFTLIAILTLALGIGANTGVFSVVNAALLRPLPFVEPERLVMLQDLQPVVGAVPEETTVSFPEFEDWRKQNRVFDEVAALFHTNFNLTGRAEPERLRGGLVSQNYFALFGVQPLLGRAFAAEEHRPGANPVVVVSYAAWQQMFGGDAALLGQTLTLNGKGYTLIGVMPAEAPNFSRETKTALWLPLEANLPWNQRSVHFLNVFARLKAGVTVAQAQREMEALTRSLAAANQTNHGIRLHGLQKWLLGDLRTSLLLMSGAVGLVLLIACANVANLLLARATVRVREFAIRAALGANRRRLIRQLLTESLLLALVGGAFGAALAWWATDTLGTLWPAGLTRPERIQLDWRVLGFAAAATLLAAILFGLAPALLAAGGDPNQSLKDSAGQAAGAARRRLRQSFVVAEIALATLLLLGAGLLLKSFWLLQRTPPGFNPENALALNITLPSAKYRDDRQRAAFFQQTLQRIAALPGVQSVGAVNNLPLAGGGMNGDFYLEGLTPTDADQAPVTEKYIISPDYFRALGIRLLKGRYFTEQDAAGKPGVAIINETIARRFWPDAEPLGERLSWNNQDWFEIVGVVADVKHEGLDKASDFQSYLSYLQNPSPAMTIVTRTAGDPLDLVASIRAQTLAVDREQPIHNVRTLAQIVTASIADRRFTAAALGAFAMLALALAAVGVYGVMSFAVAQRAHEIGVRMALGARQPDVWRLVLMQGLKLTLTGVGIGLAAAFALTRWMASLLFGVSPTDPLTFAAIAALLTVVALAACWIPARRATRVDPLVALRCD